MNKNKGLITTFFTFLLAVVMFLPCAMLLTACDGADDTEQQLTPPLSYIEAEFDSSIYNVVPNQPIVIDYRQDLSFNASDIRVVLKYDDGTSSEITSGFTFNVVKLQGEDEVEVTSYLPGAYKVKISYNSYNTELYFTVGEIPVTKDDLTCSLQDSYEYNPLGAVEPEFTLHYSTELLTKYEDYLVEYGPNNEIGENYGCVTINFTGSYSGSVVYLFDIVPLTAGNVSFTDVTQTYDGEDKKASCWLDLTTPIQGITNIEYDFYDNTNTLVDSVINAGTYRVVARVNVQTGYNPVDDVTFTLTINPMDIADVDLSQYDADNITMSFKNADYTTDDFAPYIAGPMSGVTYDLAMATGEDIDNLNVSSSTKHGQINITGTGNYTGTLEVPFRITPYSAGNFNVILADNYVYNGNAKTISEVRAYFGEEYIVLTEGTHYTIEYSHNVDAGQASYTITGLGNYGGTKQGTIYISKANIEISDYGFANSAVTYNGLDQKTTLLTLNKAVPEQVEVKFTLNNYYGELDAEEITEMTNATSWFVYATFVVKEAYATNFELSGNDRISGTVSINPVVVSSVSFDGENSHFEGGEGSSEDRYYYTYSGSVKVPKIVATATVNGEPYTLVEGTDYELHYYDASSWHTENYIPAKDAHNYGVAINYANVGAAGKSNFAYANDGSYYIRLDNCNLFFNINKRTLEDANITWPTVYKYLWTSKGYFDLSNYTTQCTSNMTGLYSEEFAATFNLVCTNDGAGYGPWLNSSNQIEVTFTASNYQATNHTSTATITSPFTGITLNGSSVSLATLDALDTLTLGDKLVVTFGEEYKVLYSNNSYDYEQETYTSNNGFWKFIGTDTKDGEYCYETAVFISLVTADGQTAICGRRFDINRNIFDTLMTERYDNDDHAWHENTNYLIQNCLYKDQWLVDENDRLTITLAQEGYKFNYTLVDAFEDTQDYNEKVTTMTWTNDSSSVAQVIVNVFNAQDDNFLTLYYNFEIPSVVTLSMNPSVEFVFGSNGELKSFTPLNDEANYILADDTWQFSVNFDRKSEVIRKFVGLMEKYGYTLDEDAKLIITTTNSIEQRELTYLANYRFGVEKLDIDVQTSRETKANLLGKLAYLYPEYTETELTAKIANGEAYDMLVSVYNETSALKNRDLQDIYEVWDAICRLQQKIGSMESYQNEYDYIKTNVNQLITLDNNLENIKDQLVALYLNSILKTSSPLVLARVTLVETKKALLAARLEEDKVLIAAYESEIEELESSFNALHASIMTEVNDLITNFNTQKNSLNTFVENIGYINADHIAYWHAYVDGQNYFNDFSNDSNDFLDYNTNIWTGEGIKTEGTTEYWYADNDNSKTYVFNVDDLSDGDPETNTYVCYVYDGAFASSSATGFDSATILAFYRYESDIAAGEGQIVVYSQPMIALGVADNMITDVIEIEAE